MSQNDRSLADMLVNIIAASLAIVLGVVLTPYILSIVSISFWLLVVFAVLWWYRVFTRDE